MAEIDEKYWAALVLADEASSDDKLAQTEAARLRHEAACKRALASEFQIYSA